MRHSIQFEYCKRECRNIGGMQIYRFYQGELTCDVLLALCNMYLQKQKN